jgi:hypothetical protein
MVLLLRAQDHVELSKIRSLFHLLGRRYRARVQDLLRRSIAWPPAARVLEEGAIGTM